MITDRRSVLKWLGIGSAAAAVTVAPEQVRANIADLGEKYVDPYDIPADLVPAGMQYNWKRVFVTSIEPDFENIDAMIQSGWKPVPASRHADHFKHKAINQDNRAYWVEIGGLVLMEKPIVTGEGQ